MRGYVCPFSSKSIVSIEKKINMQTAELSKISEVFEADVKRVPENKFEIIKNIILYGSYLGDYSDVADQIVDPDYLLIRYSGVDRQFIRFLKTIKHRYPDCTIVIEIPTFPYMGEKLKSKVNWLLLFGELNNRRKLKKYVDRFLLTDEFDEVFGVETIIMMNGISVNDISPITESLPQSINLIAVAYMQSYDGFERLINGLYFYYQQGGKRDIKLFMVGDGKEKENYEQLVRELGLGDRVHFFGKLVGDKLTEVYQKATIGVEAMGLYKNGINRSSSIKTREYLAYGLPIVGGTDLDVFDKNPAPYFLQFPNDSSIIDVNRLITFYDDIYSGRDRTEVSREIHQYALKNVDISVTLKGLLDYLLSEFIKSESVEV